jgi:hypothetical protein
MSITDRSLLETLRELVVVRNHNLAFGPKDDQATLLMMAEGSLVLVGLERFLRVTLGSEATDTDTLPNLLEKATGDRLKLLTLPADDRSLAVSQIKSVRNTTQHGNYEQAAKDSLVASPREYFGKVYASEVEKLYLLLAHLVDQLDSSRAQELLGATPRRLVLS